MTLGVTEIERIDDHADVGGVFAGLAHMRDLDELERSFVQSPLKRLVALKIAVGFLDHNLALEQQTLEHLADVERGKVRVMRAQRDVFQVEEHSHCGVMVLHTHQAMMLATSRSRDSENCSQQLPWRLFRAERMGKWEGLSHRQRLQSDRRRHACHYRC